MILAYNCGVISNSCLPHLKNSQINTMFKAMGITFSYLSPWEIFLHQNDENTYNTDWKLWLNEYSQCACLVYLTSFLSHFRLKCKTECVSLKLL